MLINCFGMIKVINIIANRNFLPGKRKREKPYAHKAPTAVLITEGTKATIIDLYKAFQYDSSWMAVVKLAKTSSLGIHLIDVSTKSSGPFKLVIIMNNKG